MHADFDIRCTDEYPLGTCCKCGRTIHLNKCEAFESVNHITCHYCGYMMALIRPKAIKIDID